MFQQEAALIVLPFSQVVYSMFKVASADTRCVCVGGGGPVSCLTGSSSPKRAPGKRLAAIN